MYRWIAVFTLFCTSISLAEVKSQFYKFGDCVGQDTICDDEFNEVIIISIDDSGAIATDIRFDHPHVVETSEGKMTLNGRSFNSAHLIINNLGYEFTFVIIGNAESAVAEEVIIHLGEEELASIKLREINSLNFDLVGQ